MLRILVLTGMGACPREPYQGLYICEQVKALKAHLDADKWQIDYCHPRGKVAAVRGIAKYGLWFWQFLFTYVFSAKRYDIIHLHYFYPTIIFAIVYRWLRYRQVKIICTFHGSDLYLHQSPSNWYQKACGYLAGAIFVSPEFQTRGQGLNIAHSQVLCVGARDDFCPIAAKKDVDLLIVGNVNHNKGCDRLITLLKQLPDSITVAVAGEGPYKAQLAAFDQVECLGFVPPTQLLKLYNRSRFLLSLSRLESFGLSMTEGMLCGLPVIATRTDGSVLQVEDGVCGSLLNNDDLWLAEYGGENIAKLVMMDDSEYQQWSQAAINHAQQYRLSNVVRSLEQIYDAL